MEMKQIYDFVNPVIKEVVGETAILQEDLSNVVDVGKAVFDANSYDHFVKGLVDRIGKTIFVIRKYTGSAPSVLMDAWEYGAVLQKIRARMPEVSENESWQLEDGASYDQDIFYKPDVAVKFWNKRTTFEVDNSITDEQVKSAFSSAEQLNRFIEMLYNEVDKTMQVATDALIMRTINNFTAEVIWDEYESGGSLGDLTASSGVKAVNLLKLYNDAHSGATLTQAEAIESPEFLRFAAFKIRKYVTALGKMSTLFNLGGERRFTPRDYLHIIMLTDFKAGADIYLQSSTFHKELVEMPNAEEVACWQATGTDLEFSNTSKINVKTADNHEVTVDGVLCVMFDRDALGVTNYKRRTTTHRNNKAEFTNYFHKQEAGYFNDYDENFVVFFIK